MNDSKTKYISSIATLISDGNITEAITSIRNENLASEAKNILKESLSPNKENVNNITTFIEAYSKEEDLLSYKRPDGEDYRSVMFDFSQVLSEQDSTAIRNESVIIMQRFVEGLIRRKDKERGERPLNRELFSFRTPTPYLLSEFVEDTIGVSSPDKFNDPFDCLILSNIRTAPQQYKKAGDFFINTYIRELEKVRIRCFIGYSKELKDGLKEPYLNTLMWGHYAQSHQGLCIRYSLYEKSPLLGNGVVDKHSIGRLDKVVYDNTPVKRRDRLVYEQCFLYKNKAWRYENEYRLVYYDRERDKPFYTIPLASIGLKITGIYFGLNCEQETKTLVRRIMDGRSVTFYNIQCDERYTNVLKVQKTT